MTFEIGGHAGEGAGLLIAAQGFIVKEEEGAVLAVEEFGDADGATDVDAPAPITDEPFFC